MHSYAYTCINILVVAGMVTPMPVSCVHVQGSVGFPSTGMALTLSQDNICAAKRCSFSVYLPVYLYSGIQSVPNELDQGLVAT
jgi:hypothetical protein